MDKKQIEQMIDRRTPATDRELTAVQADYLATASVARTLGMTPRRLEKILRRQERDAAARPPKPQPRGRAALVARQAKARPVGLI